MIVINELNIFPILTLLFQGAIAGLIVLFVTHKLQEKKERSLLNKHSLLVYLEIYGHIAMIEDMLKHNAIPESSNNSVFFDYESWKSSQIYLTVLSIKELTLIGAYYQSVLSLNPIIKAYAGQQLNAANLFSFRTTLEMAKRVNELLKVHWESENCSHK